jgi:hypothetical protein
MAVARAAQALTSHAEQPQGLGAEAYFSVRRKLRGLRVPVMATIFAVAAGGSSTIRAEESGNFQQPASGSMRNALYLLHLARQPGNPCCLHRFSFAPEKRSILLLALV